MYAYIVRIPIVNDYMLMYNKWTLWGVGIDVGWCVGCNAVS